MLVVLTVVQLQNSSRLPLFRALLFCERATGNLSHFKHARSGWAQSRAFSCGFDGGRVTRDGSPGRGGILWLSKLGNLVSYQARSATRPLPVVVTCYQARNVRLQMFIN